MDKIAELFCTKMQSMYKEYERKIHLIPSWQLDSLLPEDIKQKTTEEKIIYLVEKYKISNPIYLLLKEDLNLLNKRREKLSFEDFKSLNIDPRYLESKGLKEEQIKSYFEFTSFVKTLL